MRNPLPQQHPLQQDQRGPETDTQGREFALILSRGGLFSRRVFQVRHSIRTAKRNRFPAQIPGQVQPEIGQARGIQKNREGTAKTDKIRKLAPQEEAPGTLFTLFQGQKGVEKNKSSSNQKKKDVVAVHYKSTERKIKTVSCV